MPAIFIHLSDIHFGQERDDSLHIHNDVKEELIADASEVIKRLPGGAAQGILVTGDIAYSGKPEQYQDAAKWLDRLAEAAGCEKFRIQMVPGNHDLDRDLLSHGGKLLLDAIRAGGAVEYEKVLSNELDRRTLFARFREYEKFCEGYDCFLDAEGRFTTNMVVELSLGRSIRFIRLNSSLLCHGKENKEEPELLIGSRQFTIPRIKGEEVVALIHHPLNWLKDSDDVSTYLRSRVRVLISGHEHNPKVAVEEFEKGTDFMMLAAGATVPSKSEETYVFTYNIIEFDWDAESDGLHVVMHPRVWNPQMTRFELDERSLVAVKPQFVLGCPNFRAGLAKTAQALEEARLPTETSDRDPVIEMVAESLPSQDDSKMPPEIPGYRLELLRFFRDLTEGERLHILISQGALPANSDEQMTQALQRRLFDWLIRQGKIETLQSLIDQFVSNKKLEEEK